MEAYTAYVNDCNFNGIVPISFYTFIKDRLVILPEPEEPEVADPEPDAD